MANPVNGQIIVTCDIVSTTAAGWNAAQKAIQEAVKTALEGIEIKAVTIDAANLGLVQNNSLIESAGDEPEPEDDTSDETEGEETEGDSSEDTVEEKKPKKDKKDKAAKGKKKGRK